MMLKFWAKLLFSIIHFKFSTQSHVFADRPKGSRFNGPDIYIPPLTGKTEQLRFTIRSGVLTSISTRLRSAISGLQLSERTDFGPNQQPSVSFLFLTVYMGVCWLNLCNIYRAYTIRVKFLICCVQAATREDLYEQTIISLTQQLDAVSSVTYFLLCYSRCNGCIPVIACWKYQILVHTCLVIYFDVGFSWICSHALITTKRPIIFYQT